MVDEALKYYKTAPTRKKHLLRKHIAGPGVQWCTPAIVSACRPPCTCELAMRNFNLLLAVLNLDRKLHIEKNNALQVEFLKA